MTSLRVVLVHNHYRERGGEDRVFEAEGALLRNNGHAVVAYTKHNDDVANFGRLDLARSTIWNRRSYDELRTLIRRHRADVVHFHNTLPLISPSAHHAARAEGATIVQSLHNFRLFCPSAQFWRDGQHCEDCVGKKVPLPGIRHACYRNSRAATGTVAAMLAVHRGLGTWTRKVDIFVAPSEFMKQKLIDCGMEEDVILVKHHFVPDTGAGTGHRVGALYVGRLAHEKGLLTLLRASETLGAELPLTIVGDGPIANIVSAAAARCPWIEWLGEEPQHTVYDLMGRALFVVAPSHSFETFGLVVAESFSKGTPVVASARGALTELVDHESTGLLIEPGNPDDLAAAMSRMCSRRIDLEGMQQAARAKYEQSFAPDSNYASLMQVYRAAQDRSRAPAA